MLGTVSKKHAKCPKQFFELSLFSLDAQTHIETLALHCKYDHEPITQSNIDLLSINMKVKGVDCSLMAGCSTGHESCLLNVGGWDMD